MTLLAREINTRRMLDANYTYFGIGLSYFQDEQLAYHGLGRVIVNDAEQTIDGQMPDIEFKGFSLRLRRHTLPDGFQMKRGDKVELDQVFEGYITFHVDGPARTFSRGGFQLLAGLTPLAFPDTGDGQPAKPTGLNLG